MRAVIATTFWVTALSAGWVVGPAAAHPAHGSAEELVTSQRAAGPSGARSMIRIGG